MNRRPIRESACDGLAAAKEAATASPARSRQLSQDKDDVVRHRAAYALKRTRTGGPASGAALGRALHDASYDGRSWAGLALMRLDAGAEEAHAT